MTDLATLAIQIDARQASDAARALDGLTQTGARTEQAIQRVTASAGQQRAGMQQLSYQIGDVAQQFAMGTNPMMIFAQQGQQVVQALAMMKGGATGLIGFLAGPWGAVIMGAAMIAGQFASKLMASADAADKTADSYRSAADAAKQLAGAQNALKLNEKRMELNDLTSKLFEVQAQNRAQKAAGGIGYNYGFGTDQESAIKLQIAGLQSTIRLTEQMNADLDKGKPKHEEHAKTVRGHASAMTELEKATLAVAHAFDQADKRGSWGSRTLAGRVDRMLADTDPSKLIGAPAQQAATLWDQIRSSATDAISTMPDLSKGTADWNKHLGISLDRLTRIGGALGAFGLSNGAGNAIGTLLSTQTGTNDKGQIITLGDRIERIFDGKDSRFGKTMSSIIQGGGTGLAVGSLVFGSDNKNAQFGAFAGGALGQAFAEGSKTLGKALGSFAGPLGSIAGSLLGGVIGGLFGKKPSGSGIASNTGTNVTANDGGIKASLSSFGLGLNQSVTKIADQLGGSVGNYSVGIGGYKGGYIQVSSNANDPFLGKAQYSAKSGSAVYDGLDATAALRAAIGVAISQGAIQGIRAGAQTLLKAGTDIEAQLGKALKFQSVFSDLKAATDPVGAALENITKKFDDLRKIFGEAGATAEDYAQLEQLLALQRADAINSARRDLVSKVSDPLNLQIRLLELMGEKEKALAASRLLELAGLKDTLQPLQAMVYTLEDATSVIEKFTPLRDDLVKFRDSLLGGSSSSLGFLTGQFRQTALAAANGDASAMAGLRSVAQDYLDAAKENASSLEQYNAARAEVLVATNNAIFAANEQIDYQKAVIESAKNSSIMADTLANLESIQTQLAFTNNEILRLWKRWDAGENTAALPVVVTS